MSNPNPRLARLVPSKCVLSFNVGLVFVGYDWFDLALEISLGEF